MNKLITEMQEKSKVGNDEFMKLKPKYISFINDMISDFDYTEVDGFAEMYDVDEDTMRKLMNLNLKVTG
ncbi:MAG: hypothetical protein DRJ01_00365 [Bacteroidetes bacterium]|nr:MAG: hypothetical protein DRJ01_00365 [Bacteroidota bacterium]